MEQLANGRVKNEPASPSEELASATSMAERRHYKRHAMIMRARLISGSRRWDCKALDVSINGVRAKTESPPAIGTAVTLALAGSVHFGGTVAWQKSKEFGITFANQPQKVAEIMAAFLPLDCLQAGHA